MSDFEDRSNSAVGACAVSKSGRRRDGKRLAVELAQKYPGIDGATMGWVSLGHRLEYRDGQYHIVDEAGFADFCFAMKMPTRAIEASKGKSPQLRVLSNSKVKRSVKSQGYVVNGGGSFPDKRLSVTPAAKSAVVPSKPMVIERGDSQASAGDEKAEKSSVSRGIPAGFMDQYL